MPIVTPVIASPPKDADLLRQYVERYLVEIRKDLHELETTTISDTAYGASWDGSTTIGPSQNAVYDRIETILTSISALISDAVYGAAWDGNTTAGASKNALYDIIETLQTELVNSAGLAGALNDETGTGLAVFGTSPALTTPAIAGATVTGVFDAGGASTEINNVAGDLSLTVAGQVGVDTTNKQLGVHDGTNEVAIPLRHTLQGTFDLAAQYDVDSDLWLIDLHSDVYPNGIYITAAYVDCTIADPVTELDANLMYCDAVAGGAFPGANPTLITAIDTVTGNYSNAAVNTAVATGKTIYIDMDADPTDANTQYHLRIHFRIPES